MILSVAIPFYNAESYLSDAIKSVLNQAFTEFELILMDDGSHDGSLDIARGFESKDSRVRVICDGCNKGLPTRLNEIAQIAKGKYLARMDADDIMHPNRLQRQMEYFQEHKDVDVLGTSYYTIDTSNNIQGVRTYSLEPKTIDEVLAHTCFLHPSIMARREWFLSNPYDKDANRMEDYNLWMRTIESNRFVNLPDYLMFYRTAGLPYFKKYVESMMGEKREIQKIKTRLGTIKYIKCIAMIYFKCAIYGVFSTLRLTDILLNMRVQNTEDLSEAKKMLEVAIK